VLPRGPAIRAGAASGIISLGTMAEARGAVAGLGQDRAGNARWLLAAHLRYPLFRIMRCPRPRKHGLELSWGVTALARAAVKRRKASAPRKSALPRSR
jgi:hypothetical protein